MLLLRRDLLRCGFRTSPVSLFQLLLAHDICLLLVAPLGLELQLGLFPGQGFPDLFFRLVNCGEGWTGGKRNGCRSSKIPAGENHKTQADHSHSKLCESTIRSAGIRH